MQGVLDGIPIALVLLAGIGAPLAGWYATRCARNPAVWFALGALTGPIALALLVVAPPGRCPECDAAVQGWASICDRCGVSLRSDSLGEPVYPPREEPGRDLSEPVTLRRSSEPSPSAFARSASPGLAALPTPIGSARTALRRESRAISPSRPMVSPMSLGTRPTITASNYVTATSADDMSAGEVLSTGVYISGNAGLEIGATYAIARDGDVLRVFGPVDTGQLTVRHQGPVRDFDVTAMDDRVIISGRDGRSSLAIVFRTIGGMRAAELELALSAPVAGAGP